MLNEQARQIAGRWVQTEGPAPPGSADDVLADYHLAGSFHLPCVLSDPTGRLSAIQRVVARDFAVRAWTTARCAGAMDRVRAFLGGMLAAHGRLDVHETLLDWLGCAHLDAARVERHLAALETVFDAAAAVRVPAYRFDSDISAVARPVAIDGSRELIARGLHREAVFWIAATYARCLAKRAAAGERGHEDGLLDLLADLGAETYADRRRRAGRVLAGLPALWKTAMSLC